MTPTVAVECTCAADVRSCVFRRTVLYMGHTVQRHAPASDRLHPGSCIVMHIAPAQSQALLCGLRRGGESNLAGRGEDGASDGLSSAPFLLQMLLHSCRVHQVRLVGPAMSIFIVASPPRLCFDSCDSGSSGLQHVLSLRPRRPSCHVLPITDDTLVMLPLCGRCSSPPPYGAARGPVCDPERP